MFSVVMLSAVVLNVIILRVMAAYYDRDTISVSTLIRPYRKVFDKLVKKLSRTNTLAYFGRGVSDEEKK